MDGSRDKGDGDRIQKPAALALDDLDPSGANDIKQEDSAEDAGGDPALPAGQEPHLDEGGPLARMPARGDVAVERQMELCQFHYSARSAGREAEAEQPLHPAVFSAWLESHQIWDHYPLFLPQSPGEPREGDPAPTPVPLSRFLHELLSTDRVPDAESEVIGRNLWRLARSVHRILEGRSGHSPFWDLYPEARDRFIAEFDTSDAGANVVKNQIAQLEEHLPSEGHVLALGDGALFHLYGRALRSKREPFLKRFHQEVNSLITSLADELRVDRLHSSQANSPEALHETLGGSAQSFVDFSVLSQALPEYRGAKPMVPERRERIRSFLETLERFQERSDPGVRFTLVHSGDLPAPPDSCDVIEDDDSLAKALLLLDESVEEMLPVFRCVRQARLEISGHYDPAVHDDAFANLNWHSLTDEELHLLRPVVVVERVEVLEGDQLAALSRLLHSGRPVHVLFLQSSARNLAGQLDDPRHGSQPAWAYLSVAHRESVVQQTSLTRPHHLFAGLLQMAESARPGVSFVDSPDFGRPLEEEWIKATAALDSRATPCFSYNPDAGDSWARRFDLLQNSQPDQLWPTRPVPYLDQVGEESRMNMSFTIAHWVALYPQWRSHFKVISPDSWGPDQMELPSYLEQLESLSSRVIPYIWLIDDEGELQRAIVSRQLSLCCLDRLHHWRILQELAGINNVYVRQAEDSARALAREEMESRERELEARHQEELEQVRSQAMGEAIDHLVAVLTQATAGRPVLPGFGPAREPVPETREPDGESGAAAPPQPESETEDDEVFEEPWINTVLCTTCNDCININPALFKYNANKQAYIDEPGAGTFAELVKGAKKCPARCIHPGAPRPDDATATAELISQAAEFNHG